MPILADARRATADGDHGEAARRWEEAYQREPVGRFLVEAARAAERGERGEELRRLAARAAACEDLGSEDRAWVADLHARLAVEDREAARREPSASAAPWVLLGAGAAVVVGGLVALGVAEGARADVRAAERSAVDGVVFGSTRAAAASDLESATTWSTVGWVGIGVGALAAAIGGGWLVARAPGGSGSTRVDAAAAGAFGYGLAVTPGGWTAAAWGSF